MPGHVKLGATGEPDPDPLPYLVVSNEMKRKDMAKPYDSKRAVWTPDGNGGFTEGIIQNDDGTKATVLLGHENKHFKSDQVVPVNPPKFEKCEDMANLTFLSEASVFWNLKSRYQAKLIYTYSGLFCVVVNPYKRFPIYTNRVKEMYKGKRREETPPHLWAVTETAYRNMLKDSKNQSMLITGESGAGKTENTKKVISYLAMVATSGKKMLKKVSLEDQIVATNPILESYGNAKTSRNDNSSRFGKFIRIHFNVQGKLSGCDIKSYLFEKSRITQQQEVERSYHIFYQMLQPAVPDLKDKCLLSDAIYDYSYVCQGRTKVDSIDDNEELQFTDTAFDIIGFSETEKWNCYKLTVAVMTMGEMKFKQKGRDEQCEPDKLDFFKKVATLTGVDIDALISAFVKPRIKVGTEWVTKGQNVDQATSSVGGIARAIYHRTFLWLIEKCNETLIDIHMKKVNFCAVLDIAGFEIFTFNGFEQLSINFVNERLQQFFNHHMFVVEQEEYLREGIDWQMVDFGMDLAACIIMFEKPMGVWAVLEEESLFPKATDKSLEDKLKSTLLGKCPTFAKPMSKTDRNAHFAVVHYAGTVSYNVTGWLEKNKDPLNETVVDTLKRSSCALMVHLWRDNPGQTFPETDEAKSGGKKKKGSGGKTVSGVFLVDLSALMATLNDTDPHFVRCIVPNTCKQPGGVEPALIMHQLTCNGVLEGIRICMRGFPNRIPYQDFRKRYAILARNKLTGSDDHQMVKLVVSSCPSFSEEKVRMGKTKVFFRAGALAVLEEERDIVVNILVRKLQAMVVARKKQKEFLILVEKREYIKVLQRVFRKFTRLRSCNWFRLLRSTWPLIGQTNMEEVLSTLRERASLVCGQWEDAKKIAAATHKKNQQMREEIHQVQLQLGGEQKFIADNKEIMRNKEREVQELREALRDAQNRLYDEEMAREEKEEETNELQSKMQNLASIRDEMKEQLALLQDDLEKQNTQKINAQVVSKDEEISHMTNAKKIQWEAQAKALEDKKASEEKLQKEKDIVKRMELMKEEMEEFVDDEKKKKTWTEKEKKKLEVEYKAGQIYFHQMQREKEDLEKSLQQLETEITSNFNKLQEEESSIFKNQVTIKELQKWVETMEVALDDEKQCKLASELKRSDLAREAENLVDSLEECNLATKSQLEINAKMEAKAYEMRKDTEEHNIAHEATMLKLRKKHQEAHNEMAAQADLLRKMKAKAEKDIFSVELELKDTVVGQERAMHDVVLGERHLKEEKELSRKLEKKLNQDENMLKSVYDDNKKLTAENAVKRNQAAVLQHQVSMLSGERAQLATQLDIAKKEEDTEERERLSLLARYKTLEHEYDGIKEQYDDERMEKDDLVHLLQKAVSDVTLWQSKYEKEVVERLEELEATKLKLQARLAEAEDVMINQGKKLQIEEERKENLVRNLEDLRRKLELNTCLLSQADRQTKQKEREIGEWRAQADTRVAELGESQGQCRDSAAELYRIKAGSEDSAEKLEDAKRENFRLAKEVEELGEQIREGGRTVHDVEKKRKLVEEEKTELSIILQVVERTLEDNEMKLKDFTTQIDEVKKEVKHRVQGMEDAFLITRTNHGKAMEALKLDVEHHSKEKAEALRSRQHSEQSLVELESVLQACQLKTHELQGQAREVHENVKAKERQFEEEQGTKEDATAELMSAERKLSGAKAGIEEVRGALEAVDRVRREQEQELLESREREADVTAQQAGVLQATRRLHSQVADLRGEVVEVKHELFETEGRAENNMMRAAQLVEELRHEQEISARAEMEKKEAEARLRELQQTTEEEETNAIQWGDKMVNKLCQHLREVELELEVERRRLADSTKSQRKAARGIHEYNLRAEEGKKEGERMIGLIDKLQQQVASYKRQIEEAEEIGTINLCKYRRVEGDLLGADDRAMVREAVLARMRNGKNVAENIELRARSLGPY